MRQARALAASSALLLACSCGVATAAAGKATRLLPHPGGALAPALFAREEERQAPALVYSIDWWQPLTEPEMLEWRPREFSRPAADRATGRVYVATRDGVVRCFDASGSLVWEQRAKGPFTGGLTLDAGKLFVPSGDGALLAYSADDGALKWSYRAGEELGTQPVIANGLVYVASFADTVFAVDEETGAWKWQYRRETPGEFTIRGASTPIADFDKLFVGFSDGSAVCLDATDGSVKWTRQLSTSPQFPDADADPQLDGNGHVFFASYASGAFSLDEETGAVVWNAPLRGVTTLLIDGDQILTGGDALVTALHAADGRELWRVGLGDAWSSRPALVARYLVVPTSKALLFLDRRSGQPLKTFDPGRGVSATPAVAGGELYVLSNYGYLYALRLARPRLR